jgi:hypothetical protein
MKNDLRTTVEVSELPWCQLTNYLRPHLKYSACLFQCKWTQRHLCVEVQICADAMHAKPFVLNTAPVIVDTEDFYNEQLESGLNKMRTSIGKPVWCLAFL